MKSLKKFLFYFGMVVVSMSLINCGSTTDPDLVTPPGNLQLQKVSNFSMQLSWEYQSTGTDTIFFQIARKVGTSEWEDNFAELDGDTKEYLDFVPTTDSLVYGYKVRVYNMSLAETSEYSSATAWFAPATFPDQMQIQQSSQQELFVSWQDHCAGEEGYIVDKKTNDADWEENYLLLAPDIEEFTDEVALFDSVSYRLYAYLGDSRTEYLIDSRLASLLPPTDLVLSAPDFNKIRLNWQDNSSGEEGFYIDKKTGESEWQTAYAVVDSNITTYVDDNTLPCATIEYRVQAYKGEFVSLASDPVSININLQILGSYSTQGSAVNINLPTGNDYLPQWTAFIADGYEGLQIVDCHNPASPENITTYQDLWGDRTLASFVSGNFVYVTTQTLVDAVGGIQKVDITDFNNPQISNVTPTTGIPRDVFVDGDFAYIAEGENGISIMYIAAAYPAFVSNIDLNDSRSIMVIMEEQSIYALVADGLNSGLVVVNVTDPANPFTVAEYPLPGLAADVYFSNGYVYLANGEEGLAVFDFADPQNPVLIKQINTGGFVNAVSAKNNYVYITDIEKGFFVIQVQNPQDAFIQGSLIMDTQPLSLHVTGSYAYLTDNQGMKIVNIEP